MAKAIGARAIVTVGSDDKAQLCTDLGAVHAINYKTHDFVDEVLAMTDGHGVHAVLDMVGGDYVNRNLKCLAPQGHHVSIAVLRGHQASIDIRRVMGRRLHLSGSLLRPRSPAEKARLCTELSQTIWPYVVEGKIRPVIYETFPLADAAEAHRLMDSGEMHGKLVLTVDH